MEPPPVPPTMAAPKSTTAPANQPVVLPRLAVLPREVGWTFKTPTKRIHNSIDVSDFGATQAYRDIGTFLGQLNRAMCPRRKVASAGGPGAAATTTATTTLATTTPASGAVTTFTLASPRNDPPSVCRLRAMLDKAGDMIGEAPPDTGPRRFGNRSFRIWNRLLDERVDSLLMEAIAPEVLAFGAGQTAAASPDSNAAVGAIDELRAYFLGAFGSSQRLDYGTGHELSFLAFLGCLWKLGAFTDKETTVAQEKDIERSIVLGVIEPYLNVVRKLIQTYTLEPAGSRGVWGLDDHFFLSYIFGSAQLARPITDDEPTPQEGSVFRAPKPADVTKPASVEVQRELNMYFSAVGFINDVKTGPFWEHSSMLYDVSGIKDGWGKINKGMAKMYNVEVLGKFPVVQHFPFGSLFSWERDPDAGPLARFQPVRIPDSITPGSTTPTPHPPQGGLGGVVAVTAAPWAQGTTRMPGGTAGQGPGQVSGQVPGFPYTTRMAPPSAGAGRAPPPDPVSRQAMGRPGPSPATGAGMAPPDDMVEGSTQRQTSLTRAPWARDQ